jgi:hypothetical protein
MSTPEPSKSHKEGTEWIVLAVLVILAVTVGLIVPSAAWLAHMMLIIGVGLLVLVLLLVLLIMGLSQDS